MVTEGTAVSGPWITAPYRVRDRLYTGATERRLAIRLDRTEPESRAAAPVEVLVDGPALWFHA